MHKSEACVATMQQIPGHYRFMSSCVQAGAVECPAKACFPVMIKVLQFVRQTLGAIPSSEHIFYDNDQSISIGNAAQPMNGSRLRLHKLRTLMLASAGLCGNKMCCLQQATEQSKSCDRACQRAVSHGRRSRSRPVASADPKSQRPGTCVSKQNSHESQQCTCAIGRLESAELSSAVGSSVADPRASWYKSATGPSMTPSSEGCDAAEVIE